MSNSEDNKRLMNETLDNSLNGTYDMANLTIDEDRKTSIDVPDFEYDEDYNSLVADKEIEDFQLDQGDPFDHHVKLNNDLLMQSSTEKMTLNDRKIGNGNLTPENFIEEDFEAEIGPQLNQIESVEDEKVNKLNELHKKIDQYGVVTVSGSDHAGRPVIILSACNIPNKIEIERQSNYFQNQQHFFDVLLEYLTKILDGYVEADYTLVYLHHGLRSDNKPSFQWLLRVYKILDRKFKKNLKALYLVHPSYFIKAVWQIFKPFISVKFGKKVTYCNHLGELKDFMDVKTLPIPDKVKQYDMSLSESKSTVDSSGLPNSISKSQLFKASLNHIIESNNGNPIPRVVRDTIDNIKQFGMLEEGIFRKSGNSERIKYLKKLYNEGQQITLDNTDSHVSACLLKMFLRELNEPLLTFELYNEIMSLQGTLDTSDKVDVIRDLITERLPTMNYILLKYIIDFLALVADNSNINKMNVKNLSIVFGPNFLWPPVSGLKTNTQQSSNSDNSNVVVNEFSLKNVECINNFVELVIKFNKEIFIKEINA